MKILFICIKNPVKNFSITISFWLNNNINSGTLYMYSSYCAFKQYSFKSFQSIVFRYRMANRRTLKKYNLLVIGNNRQQNCNIYKNVFSCVILCFHFLAKSRVLKNCIVKM